MEKLAALAFGFALLLPLAKLESACEGLVQQIWNGQNPARLLARKLEPSFTIVQIDYSRIEEVVASLAESKITVEIPEWNYPPYLQDGDSYHLANFFLVLNSINYSFFDTVTGEPYRAGKDVGSSLMTSRLTLNWGILKGLPNSLSDVDEEFVQFLFQADNDISMLEARTAALREAGHFLDERGEGGVLDWISSLKTRDAGAIAVSIPTVLPSWRDPFLKRAQLFVAMLYGRFQNRRDNPIDKDSLKNLTVFADYRLPQTLRAMGILKLRESDEKWIEAGHLVSPGSNLELELRAASILAGDRMVAAMNQNGFWGQVTVLESDYLLWSVGRALSKGIEMPGILIRPATEHRTVTTDY